MEINLPDGLTPLDVPPFDLRLLDASVTASLADSVQAQFNEAAIYRQRAAEEAYGNRVKAQNALKQAAANTSQINSQLDSLRDSQSELIAIQREQLKLQKQQLDILRSIFDSEQDGVMVEKEIKELLASQIEENHPLWEYVKDKGGDIATAGIVQGAPVLYEAFKSYLSMKGIFFF